LPEKSEEDERGAGAEGTFDPPLNYDDELQKLEKGPLLSLECSFVLAAICQNEDQRVCTHIAPLDYRFPNRKVLFRLLLPTDAASLATI